MSPGLALKADWQAEGLYDYVERFLEQMRMEQERRVDQVLTAARLGSVDQVDLSLSPGEVQAFLDLLEALHKGWETGHNQVMDYYPTYDAQARKQVVWKADEEFTIQDAWQQDGAMMRTPDELIGSYRNRELQLAGIYEQARLDKTRGLIAEMTSEGWSYEAQARRLGEEYPTFMDHRLRNIARTEGAYLHEHGEFTRTASSPLVIGWEFHAIMDSSTTIMCRERHGKVYMRGDEGVDVPPLHFQCRSELVPIFAGEDPELDALARDIEFEEQPMPTFGDPPTWVDWKNVKTLSIGGAAAAETGEAASGVRTAAQLQSWGERQAPHIAWDVAKMDDVYAHEVASTFARMQRRYPNATQGIEAVRVVDNLPDHASARMTVMAFLDYNEKYWTKAASGMNAAGTTAHEIGHRLHGAILQSRGVIGPDAADRIAQELLSGISRGSLSHYAKTTWREGFAEAVRYVETVPRAQWPVGVDQFAQRLDKLRERGVL